MKTKTVLTALVITVSSLVSATSFGATLSFMTSEGKTSIKDAAKIVSVQTGLSLKGDDQHVDSIVLIVKDANGNTCQIDKDVLPGTDMVVLALNLLKSSVIVGCKISSPSYPGSGAEKFQLAKQVWFGDSAK